MDATVRADTSHHHHWIIEPASGPRSAGECKHCHAHRDFPNWLAETDFMGREERSMAAGAPFENESSRRTSW